MVTGRKLFFDHVLCLIEQKTNKQEIKNNLKIHTMCAMKYIFIYTSEEDCESLSSKIYVNFQNNMKTSGINIITNNPSKLTYLFMISLELMIKFCY